MQSTQRTFRHVPPKPIPRSPQPALSLTHPTRTSPQPLTTSTYSQSQQRSHEEMSRSPMSQEMLKMGFDFLQHPLLTLIVPQQLKATDRPTD